MIRKRYCSDTFPGPTVSAFGAHSMRVVFSSDSSGSGNGFKALYEIRPAPKQDIPTHETSEPRGDGAYRCGRRIRASDNTPSGSVMSPNFPIKYNKDVHCIWEIIARDGHKALTFLRHAWVDIRMIWNAKREILLTMEKMEIEGEMSSTTASCQKAVIRVSGAPRPEYCGTDRSVFTPIVTKNNTVRISFLTSPDKVNGLKGFNMSWTEKWKNVRLLLNTCVPTQNYVSVQCYDVMVTRIVDIKTIPMKFIPSISNVTAPLPTVAVKRLNRWTAHSHANGCQCETSDYEAECSANGLRSLLFSSMMTKPLKSNYTILTIYLNTNHKFKAIYFECDSPLAYSSCQTTQPLDRPLAC
ncbi:CUB domain protein [Dictyocaulus viviparus]|uniref:CUB domain protein n=1 Tax=Dictyocaulus viviparus TaxID=29172 RepID=A0A0D8XJY8_DICVI|nr:CUB domain protein [Dictyocaulus viviparus]